MINPAQIINQQGLAATAEQEKSVEIWYVCLLNHMYHSIISPSEHPWMTKLKSNQGHHSRRDLMDT